MTKWRDSRLLVGIITVIIGSTITSIVAPTLLPIISTWIETKPDRSKPTDEVANFGEAERTEGQHVKTETLCSEYYPDFCVKQDYDCSDIPMGNFTVKEPDPMNFDTDGDGIGCE